MEISLRVAVAAIVILLVVVVVISLVTQMGGDTSNQLTGIFDWLGGILGGAPT